MAYASIPLLTLPFSLPLSSIDHLSFSPLLQSLTEFPAYWGERPELFAAISDAQTEELRAKAVLRWFIVRFPLLFLRLIYVCSLGVLTFGSLHLVQCTLKGQYTSRNEKMGSEKKYIRLFASRLLYRQPILPSLFSLAGPSTLSSEST
jgi:oxysterol-binding protein-related protein 9/10/11